MDSVKWLSFVLSLSMLLLLLLPLLIRPWWQ
jgi:hypothetical protein